jgi:hypothetical protein
MHMISYLSFALAEGNQYLNDLFWVIYDMLATFTQIGAFLLSSAERGVALTGLTQEELPVVNTSAGIIGAALKCCARV